MIARIWHGITDIEKADKYLDILNETGIPDYRRTAGNAGAFVLRRIEDGIAHFFTLTFWDSYDAIKRFAGSDYEKAKYYPQDSDFLLDFEPEVQHFELFGELEERRPVGKLKARPGVPRWW